MKQSFRSRMKGGETLIGSWLTIGSGTTAEIMAQSGFDWLAIDMEHSVIELATAQEMIRIVDLHGVTPLVRVGHNQPI